MMLLIFVNFVLLSMMPAEGGKLLHGQIVDSLFSAKEQEDEGLLSAIELLDDGIVSVIEQEADAIVSTNVLEMDEIVSAMDQMGTSVTKLTRRLRSEEETKWKDKRPLRSQNDTQEPRGKKKRDLGMVICAEGGGGRLLTKKQKLS